MMGDNASTLQRKIAEARARAQQQQTPAPSVSPAQENYYAHLAPEPDYEPDPFDALLNSVNILDAYKRWCGKMTPQARKGQTESIMISCPKPSHRDSNPSAWVNTKLNTWYCGACQEGGDIYDIAAFHFGVDNYKTGENFGKLRRLMAESMGYSVAKVGRREVPYLSVVPDPVPQVEQPEQEPPPTIPLATGTPEPPNFTPTPTPSAQLATPALPVVTKPEPTLEEELAEVVDLNESQIIFPTLDWRSIVTPDTFLADYMEACCVDDIAEEYHFWNGLLALGLAAGRDAYLQDSPPVYGNLFVCLLGLTGDGKSRSLRHLRKVISKALPFDHNSDYPKGAQQMVTPSSAEAMIQLFTYPVYDPNDPKRIVDYAPLRGLVEFAELAELAIKAGRAGNALKPTLIDMYDMKDTVGTVSVTNGVKSASQPFCSVFSSTQPSSLKDILQRSDASSGFLNRWVFASGKPKQRSFFQSDIVDVSRPIESLKRVHGWIGFGKTITVEPDAISIMEAFHRSLLEKLIQNNDSGLLNRLPLLYKKLLLLFAVNEHSSVVTADMANRVVAMHSYQTETYDIPAQHIGVSETDEVYRTIAEIVKAHSKEDRGPSLGFVKQRIKHKNYRIETVNKVIKIMESMGDIEIYSSPQGQRGRPTVRYRWIGA